MLRHGVPITMAGLLAVIAVMGFWRVHVLSGRDIGVLTGQVDDKVADWEARRVPASQRAITFVLSDARSGQDPFVEPPDPTQWQRTMEWLGHSVFAGKPAETSLTVFAESFQGEQSAVTWVHDGFSKVSEEGMEKEISKAIVKAHDAGAEINIAAQDASGVTVLKALKKLEGVERGGVKVGANKVILAGTSWPKLKTIPSLSAYDFSKPGNIIELANIWVPREEFISKTALLHVRYQDGTEKETAVADLWSEFRTEGGMIEKLCRLVRQFATMIASMRQVISKQEQALKEIAAKEAAEHAARIAEEARKARRGKRSRPDVAGFEFQVEREVLTLQRELLDGRYEPGPSRVFEVCESKKRLISAVPYRDRVVHHAICNVIEPVFERGFIHDSYANRKGKGTHKALARLTHFCRGADYALKCDVVKYFESVDREILLGLLGRRIADASTLGLLSKIIGLEQGRPSGRGIPIGNLTSQLFANIYLDEFDHFVKERLGVRRYLRYVDDFVLLHDDKARLHEARAAMEAHLATLGLKLHPGKTQVFPVARGVPFLGFRVFRTHRLIRKTSFFHFRRKLRRNIAQWRAGLLAAGRFKACAAGWVAHASWGDTWGLRRNLLAEIRPG
ncbi:MAG: group II intron reverse transcriptase domain-containing protein [Elusimicrobia bacterium]|nr:group II intron reverse transcriptase domain-containing protein [Elusimicrobiota bacterium]